jgi:uncharacterized protein YecE (DUF72 family)
VHVVDPFVTERVTSAIYFRLHGIGGSRHVYTDGELRRLASLVAGADDACVMFNNLPREGDSDRFRRILVKEAALAKNSPLSPLAGRGSG